MGGTLAGQHQVAGRFQVVCDLLGPVAAGRYTSVTRLARLSHNHPCSHLQDIELTAFLSIMEMHTTGDPV